MGCGSTVGTCKGEAFDSRRLPDEGRLHEICWGVLMNYPNLPIGAKLLKAARLVAIGCGADDPAWANEKRSPI